MTDLNITIEDESLGLVREFIYLCVSGLKKDVLTSIEQSML